MQHQVLCDWCIISILKWEWKKGDQISSSARIWEISILALNENNLLSNHSRHRRVENRIILCSEKLQIKCEKNILKTQVQNDRRLMLLCKKKGSKEINDFKSNQALLVLPIVFAGYAEKD